MMERNDLRFRHENKYLLSPWQEAVLRVRAAGLLMPDAHARENGGTYHIHSLYFDDPYDSCLWDNLGGADPRFKYRIRYYNRNLDYIVLEKKTRKRGLGVKTSCALSIGECEQMMRGVIPDIRPEMEKTKQTLLSEMRVKGLVPRVLVDYRRTPFVYPGGNVRITFDRDLSASEEIGLFLTGNYHMWPVMENGQCLMEVKWDELLPRHIKEMVQPETLTWTAFSKYALCRSVGLCKTVG